ncbi:hypothetical protein HY640_02000 [Candidatus Woesearchaeota archaeon]|nr:hypothetical protein [Candidatus Woesearchaeota archaeon]
MKPLQIAKLVIYFLIAIVLTVLEDVPPVILIILAAGFTVYGLWGLLSRNYYRLPLYLAAVGCLALMFLGYKNTFVVAAMLFVLMLDVFMQ